MFVGHRRARPLQPHRRHATIRHGLIERALEVADRSDVALHRVSCLLGAAWGLADDRARPVAASSSGGRSTTSPTCPALTRLTLPGQRVPAARPTRPAGRRPGPARAARRGAVAAARSSISSRSSTPTALLHRLGHAVGRVGAGDADRLAGRAVPVDDGLRRPRPAAPRSRPAAAVPAAASSKRAVRDGARRPRPATDAAPAAADALAPRTAERRAAAGLPRDASTPGQLHGARPRWAAPVATRPTRSCSSRVTSPARRPPRADRRRSRCP